jgi:hypothetical protein
MNKEQQDHFKNARDRFTTEVDSFLIAYDNAVNENAELIKEVERLKAEIKVATCEHEWVWVNPNEDDCMKRRCERCGETYQVNQITNNN